MVLLWIERIILKMAGYVKFRGKSLRNIIVLSPVIFWIFKLSFYVQTYNKYTYIKISDFKNTFLNVQDTWI